MKISTLINNILEDISILCVWLNSISLNKGLDPTDVLKRRKAVDTVFDRVPRPRRLDGFKCNIIVGLGSITIKSTTSKNIQQRANDENDKNNETIIPVTLLNINIYLLGQIHIRIRIFINTITEHRLHLRVNEKSLRFLSWGMHQTILGYIYLFQVKMNQFTYLKKSTKVQTYLAELRNSQ